MIDESPDIEGVARRGEAPFPEKPPLPRFWVRTRDSDGQLLSMPEIASGLSDGWLLTGDELRNLADILRLREEWMANAEGALDGTYERLVSVTSRTSPRFEGMKMDGEDLEIPGLGVSIPGVKQ